MEDQYRHQLQSLAEQLQRKTDEAQRHKDTLANTQQLLQKQQEQMTAQLLQKEEELNTMYVRNQQLQVWPYIHMYIYTMHKYYTVLLYNVHVHVVPTSCIGLY